MEILRFGLGQARPVEKFGSRFDMARVGVFDGQLFVGAMYVPPGGKVGYHPATIPQLFLVVQGGGWVRAGDEEPTAITTGEGAHWQAGESHEAGSEGGMTALVIRIRPRFIGTMKRFSADPSLAFPNSPT